MRSQQTSCFRNGRYIVFSASRQGRLGIFLYDRELLTEFNRQSASRSPQPTMLMAVRLPLSRVRMGSGIFWYTTALG